MSWTALCASGASANSNSNNSGNETGVAGLGNRFTNAFVTRGHE
jgi:hypothetical protein